MSTWHYLADPPTKTYLDIDKLRPCDPCDGTRTVTPADLRALAVGDEDGPWETALWAADWQERVCGGRPLYAYSEHVDYPPWRDEDYNDRPDWTRVDVFDLQPASEPDDTREP